MKASTDLLLNKERRSRSWQDWSQGGRKNLLKRLICEKVVADDFEPESYKVESYTVEIGNDVPVDSSELVAEVSTEESAYDSEDEELDLIVSSWKRNFYFFQQEQAKRAAAAKSENASTTMDTLDADEEDSILMAILEEDESVYEEDCEEDECDEDTTFDERTVFSLATHEESEFRDFVRRQEQKRLERPFLERFMEVLGMTEEEEEEEDLDAASIGDATCKTVTSCTSAVSRQQHHEEKAISKSLRLRGQEGERDLAVVDQNARPQNLPSVGECKRVTVDDEEFESLVAVRAPKEKLSRKAKRISHVHFAISRNMTM
jgi:hypothetical protein